MFDQALHNMMKHASTDQRCNRAKREKKNDCKASILNQNKEYNVNIETEITLQKNIETYLIHISKNINCRGNISPTNEILTRGFKTEKMLFVKRNETHRFIKRTLSEQSWL